MKFFNQTRGYLLLQCVIALFCAGLGFSLLIKMHVKSLQVQQLARSQAWATLHTASARHIQCHYSISAASAWQQSLAHTLPAPQTQIAWQLNGAIRICWQEDDCWTLD